MTEEAAGPGWRGALPAAAAGGLALSLVFPAVGWEWLGWIALVPLLIVIARSASARQAWASGWLAGAVFFACSCPWVRTTIAQYGGLSPALAGVVFFLFAALMGAYLGLFAVAAQWAGSRLGHRLAVMPFAWVAMEWLRTYTPMGGFPWNLLGYSQYEHAGFMLSATVAGVYGASFLIALTNTLVAALLLRFYDSRGHARLRALPAACEAIGLGLVLAFATLPYHPPTLAPPQMRARLVQPDTPLNQSWSAEQLDQFLAAQVALSSPGRVGYPPAESDPKLIVWPEQAAPLSFETEPALQQAAADLQQRTHAAFLFEEVYRAPAAGGKEEGAPRNAALLIASNGTIGPRYDKTHLVPFGEYVPLPRWIEQVGGIGKVVANVGDFAPGDKLVLFPLDGHRFATLICYESIFPNLVRRNVALGAEWLVNLSDDGWYGTSSAAAQGLAMAQVRAIENRRWLLRDTSDGITAVIDPYGRITARLPRFQAAALEAGFSPLTATTFYTRHGDWLAAGCAVIMAVLLLAALVRPRARLSP